MAFTLEHIENGFSNHFVGSDFLKQKPTKFDILSPQLENKNTPEHAGFDGVKKPTELEPLKEVPKEILKKELSQNTPIAEASTGNDGKFPVPPNALEYVRVLSKEDGRKNQLNVLLFDLGDPLPPGKANEIIARAEKSNVLSSTEMSTLLTLLMDKNAALPQTESEKELEKKLDEVKTVDVEGVRAEYVAALSPYLEALRGSREKFTQIMSDLKANRQMPLPSRSRELLEAESKYVEAKKKKKEALYQSGTNTAAVADEMVKEKVIFLEKLNSSFSPLEKNILDKATALLAKGERKQEIQTQQPLRNLEKEREALDSSTPQENASRTFGTHDFSFEFEGKKLVVSRGDPNGSNYDTVKVIFEDKEIAHGFITDGAPNIEINKSIVAGPLLANTEEEKAVAWAMRFIEKMKPAHNA